MTIKQKIFFPILFAILLLGILGYVMMTNTSEELKQHIYSEVVKEKKDEIASALEFAGRQAMLQAALFSGAPSVIEAYRLAHEGDIDNPEDPKLQQAREQLREDLRPFLESYAGGTGDKLKLHYHLPNGRSLVRLWREKQVLREGEWRDISDDISQFRHTVLEVNRKGRALWGVELGRGGFVVRGLVPVKSPEGEQLGSAEVLMDFNPILDNAVWTRENDQHHGLALYMNAEYLEITTALQQQKDYPRLADKYVAVYHAGSEQELEQGLNWISAELLDKGRRGISLVRHGDLAIGLFPVTDYRDRQIGVLAYVFEVKEVEALLGNMTLTLVKIVVMLLIALGALVLFLTSYSVVTPIRHIVEFSEKVQAGDKEITLEMATGDEVGKLGNAVNHLVLAQRQVLDQIRHAGIQVTSSATELAATSRQQKATLSTQVEATNRVVKSVEGISEVTSQLVQTMQRVAAMSAETVEFARQGQQDLKRMHEVMPQLESASQAISAKLETINEKTENITTVVTTINKVADQTNLLSLNAAIEAEKAGEYGRGFTVVAREIRRLADQTAVATLDIEQMVGEMQSAVSVGVMEMDKFIQVVRHNAEDVGNISMQLTRIIDQVQNLLPNFEDVSEAMTHQSERARQINHEMSELGDGMQQTSDSLQEAFLAIEQLNDAVRGLQNEVERVRQVPRDDGSTHIKVYRGGQLRPAGK